MEGSRTLCCVVLCCRSCQRGQSTTLRHAVPYHLLPYGGTSNFHFFPVHPVFGSDGDSRWRGACYLHLFLFISLLTTLRASVCACRPPTSCLPSSSAPSPPPGSRGGRPVSAKPIGKQRPKMYFPVSSPSLTSKHSNRSRKNTMRPQFLLTMIYCHFAAASSSTKI